MSAASNDRFIGAPWGWRLLHTLADSRGKGLDMGSLALFGEKKSGSYR